MFTTQSTLGEVYATPEFSGFAERLFPLDLAYPESTTLSDATVSLPWYGQYALPSRTVSVLNDLLERAHRGERVFYEIYTDAERAADPSKKRTGLVAFRTSRTGSPTAIMSAGGAFQFVGALQDSFPHAQYLASRGVNAFALIYRPGARSGVEDLTRAVEFLHEHADELGIDMRGYSLWGGSAGARLSAWGGDLIDPQPAAVILQYTGLSSVTGHEPATLAVVGTDDWISSWRVMQERTTRLATRGIAADTLVFPGLSHGFGTGEGTVAEGWIDTAHDFWIKQRKEILAS